MGSKSDDWPTDDLWECLRCGHGCAWSHNDYCPACGYRVPKKLDPELTVSDGVEWKVQTYGSGTMVVHRVKPRRGDPHYYVYGPGGADDRECVHNRYRACEDLAAHLNGGPRPAWLDDLYRVRGDYAEALDRTSVEAVGPMVDRNPPAMDWVTDKSDEAVAARTRLMDRLFPSA